MHGILNQCAAIYTSFWRDNTASVRNGRNLKRIDRIKDVSINGLEACACVF